METELAGWERELLESAPPADAEGCGDCWRHVQTWRWPLGRRPWLCRRCWYARVRGDVTAQLLCGELVVWTTHPQRGQVLRGAIRAVGIVPGGWQPAVRWQLTGPRQDQPLGEYVGDYVDAQARLLDATSDRDEIDTDNEE